MDETQLVYLDQSDLTELEATFTSVFESDGKTGLVLNETIFYPQGGGQPSDFGEIQSSNGSFRVSKVIMEGSQVIHLGEGEIPHAGEQVHLIIDGDRRGLLSKIHTAGHLIDTAMKNIGRTMAPVKGYHFPDSPYVEYVGMIEVEEREDVKSQLDAELSRLIQDGGEVESFFASKEELSLHCDFVPDYIPENKPSRVVKVGGLGCPCGGTHVHDIAELGRVVVNKIKSKSGNTRVSYRLV